MSAEMTSPAMPTARLPKPSAVRPAKPRGSAASLAVRDAARRGMSLTRSLLPTLRLSTVRVAGCGRMTCRKSGSAGATIAARMGAPGPAAEPAGGADLDGRAERLRGTAVQEGQHLGGGVG